MVPCAFCCRRVQNARRTKSEIARKLTVLLFRWGCTIENLCATQCTEGGYYCNPDPDHNLFAGVSGVDVVNENLRELCVWNTALASYNSDGEALWWQYVKAFAEKYAWEYYYPNREKKKKKTDPLWGKLFCAAAILVPTLTLRCSTKRAQRRCTV